MSDGPTHPGGHRRAGVRDLLLLGGDESDVLAHARRLLVPLLGDELAVARSDEAPADPPPPPGPALPPSLPWPPQPPAAEPRGRVWFATESNGGWAELEVGDQGAPPDARWFATRLGGTPSAGWVLLERAPGRPPLSAEGLNLLCEAAVAAGLALVTAGLSRQLRSARTAADAATHRWAALARTNRLLVRSPDYDDTVASVLEAVVPYLADWAVLELVGAGAHVERRVGRHADPERQPLLDRLRCSLASEEASSASAAQGRLVAEVTDEDLLQLADPTDLEVLRALAPRSLAMVPLEAGGRALGTLAVAAAESGQTFTGDDLALFRSVAQQSALALTSAEMYREAERARREREEVVAMVSHDLKNPLNTIGFAATILDTPGMPEARREKQVQVIGRAVGEMNELIERLLDAARIDSGRFHVDPGPESLDALVSEALRRATTLAEQNGVRCVPPLPSGVTVMADRGRLLQVFGNLLSNAISFTPSGNTVEVGIQLEPGEVRVAIRDEGPGMDAETQRHIFDRYWQARRSGRAGAGLGLAIAKGIVQAHGGQLGVESSPGQGSTFHFSVPRVPGEGAEAVPAGAHSTSARESNG